MGGHIYSPDEEILFRTTQSLAEHGTQSIEPLQGFATKTGIDGRQYAQYGIGQPILAVPFYYAGKCLSRIFPRENEPLWIQGMIQYHDRSGDSALLRLGVSLFNQVVTALLCAVLFLFSRRITKDATAAWMAVLLFGIGSYAWSHSKPFFTEPLAALLCFSSFFLLYLGLNKQSLIRILLGGCLFGYSILVRLDSMFMLPGYAALIFFHNVGDLKFGFSTWIRAQFKLTEKGLEENDAINQEDRSTRSLCIRSPLFHYLFFTPLILAMGIILLQNKIHYGSFLSTGYEDQSEGFHFSTPVLGGLYGFLFSVGKGMFFFSPPLILFFFSISRMIKRYKSPALGLIFLVVSFFLVQCKWQNWAGGWCWGPRHIYQIHVFLALPIGLLFVSPRKTAIRCVFWALLLIGMFVQIFGSSQNFIDYYAEYFTTPQTQPNNYNMWYQETEPHLDNFYALFTLDENGKPVQRIPLHYLVSPVQNSLFYPQNSVWTNYWEMLRLGRHDFFWIKLFTPDRPPSIQENESPQKQQ
jgi:hypothetical protein